MSSKVFPQSHRPTPPVSPPVGHKPSPIMNPHLPHTPQSPALASTQSSILSATTHEISDKVSTSSTIEKMMSATSGEAMSHPAEVSNKRKREKNDDGDRQEQKKVHIENGTPGIEALHRDVGPPYRLASTPYPKSLVDLTVDLFKVYSLESIAQDVARGGPNPKKMGKTYKKHMRVMELSGKFDAVKKHEDEMGLFGMLQMPDEEWGHTQTLGKNLHNGLSAAAQSDLSQAMSMSKGRIPKDCWDPSVLALTDTSTTAATTGKPASLNGLTRKTPAQGTTAAVSAPPARLPRTVTEHSRPQRNGRKRTYTDDGFEGYGEGYADDNLADDGAFRPGDEDRQQRRKKDSAAYHFPAIRHAGYGPGTVGA